MDCNASDLFSETALDAMSIAALVTGKGRVRHINQRAAACLHSGDGLLLQDGRLAAIHSCESAQLESLIAGATSSGRNGSEAVPGGAMRISRPYARSSLQVTVIPVPKDNRDCRQRVVRLSVCQRPHFIAQATHRTHAATYGLTPAEARVADTLLDGLEIRDAAERLGITLETCRFHVKRVLAKTRTRRQTELIRLMLSLPGR